MNDSSIWPNFFIVGAAKAGTTSLFAYLGQHPEIYTSPVKEPHFFSGVRRAALFTFPENTFDTEEKYLRLFADVTRERAIGEASTSYLWSPIAAAAISERLPHAKIIILLRNPVDRAFSHYLMDVREGTQQLPFAAALRADQQSASEWGASHLYLELGLYSKQVRRYLEHFDPSRLRILFFEEFIRCTDSTVRALFDFLEVDPAAVSTLDTQTPHNPFAAPRNPLSRQLLSSRRARSLGRIFPPSFKTWVRRTLLLRQQAKPELDAQTAAFLAEYYRADAAELRSLLQRDLPWTL